MEDLIFGILTSSLIIIISILVKIIKINLEKCKLHKKITIMISYSVNNCSYQSNKKILAITMIFRKK